MGTLPTILFVAHLVGLTLGLGAACVKIVLFFRCRREPAFIPVYLQVARPITRQIILGLIILALSGIGWLVLGYDFSTLLIIKLILVASVFVVGPIIDNVAEPKFRKLAPVNGGAPSPEFLQAQSRLLVLEVIATVLFWAAFAMGVSL